MTWIMNTERQLFIYFNLTETKNYVCIKSAADAFFDWSNCNINQFFWNLVATRLIWNSLFSDPRNITRGW